MWGYPEIYNDLVKPLYTIEKSIASGKILMIYSSSSIWAEYKFQDSFKYLKSQSLFLIIGIILMLIISKYDYDKYKSKANLILGVCFLLLILVL